MGQSNSISITFDNMVTVNGLPSNFTLGNLNDGFPPPNLSQDMAVTQSVASPLTDQNQTLAIQQQQTFVDTVKSFSVVGSIAANPNGCAATSVVWTNYDLGLRFGIAANISVGHIDSGLSTITGILGNIDPNISGPAPTITWSYMMDTTPDVPVNWINPSSPTAPITANYPSGSSYQLVITPTVNETSLVILCQIQPAG